MKNYFAALLGLLLLCSTISLSAKEYYYEHIMILQLPVGLNEKEWFKANLEGDEVNQAISEFLRVGTTFDNRKELATIFTIHHDIYHHQYKCPMDWISNHLKELEENFPDMVYHLIEEKDNEITYEWFLPKTETRPPQHEIVRLMYTKQAFHYVSYEKKVAKLNEKSRERWLDWLASAQVKYIPLKAPMKMKTLNLNSVSPNFSEMKIAND